MLHPETVNDHTDGHLVPPSKDLKFDIGNMLNKAIAVIEEENDAFYGVLPASLYESTAGVSGY